MNQIRKLFFGKYGNGVLLGRIFQHLSHLSLIIQCNETESDVLPQNFGSIRVRSAYEATFPVLKVRLSCVTQFPLRPMSSERDYLLDSN